MFTLLREVCIRIHEVLGLNTGDVLHVLDHPLA